MERCVLLVILGMFVCLGEAQFHPSLPASIAEICGPTTSVNLAERVLTAFAGATFFSRNGRNNLGGWDPAPFTNTGRAVWNLQIGSDATWYHGYGNQRNSDGQVGGDSTAARSVLQLEIDTLVFMSRYLSGDDSLQIMGHSDFGAHLLALGLSCHNIYDFFGFNLLDVMNTRLRRFGDGVTQGATLSGPATNAACNTIIPGGSTNDEFFFGFYLMIACQNADEINPDVFRCAIEAQNNGLYLQPLVIPGLGPYPLGYGDLQLLGMSCLRDKDMVPEQYRVQWSAIIARISQWMYSMQQPDGSIAGNSAATIIAIQSLKAAKTSYQSWNCEAAVSNVVSLQDDQGQVAGSLGLTLLALPTLGGQSMSYVDKIEPVCFRWPFFWNGINNAN